MNLAIQVGRLTKEPELRYTQSGTAVANFTIAVDRPFKGEDGQKKSDFHRCTAWKQSAEFIANYGVKGQRCGIIGTLEDQEYTDKNGALVRIKIINCSRVELYDKPREKQEDENGQAENGQAEDADPFANA